MFAPVQFSLCFSPHCFIGNLVPKWMEEQISCEVQFMYCSLLSYRQSGPYKSEEQINSAVHFRCCSSPCQRQSCRIQKRGESVPPDASISGPGAPMSSYWLQFYFSRKIGDHIVSVLWREEGWPSGGQALGPQDFPRASPSGNPSEQPCQPSENPVHPSSFTWINPLYSATDQQERRKLIAILTGWLTVARQPIECTNSFSSSKERQRTWKIRRISWELNAPYNSDMKIGAHSCRINCNYSCKIG